MNKNVFCRSVLHFLTYEPRGKEFANDVWFPTVVNSAQQHFHTLTISFAFLSDLCTFSSSFSTKKQFFAQSELYDRFLHGSFLCWIFSWLFAFFAYQPRQSKFTNHETKNLSCDAIADSYLIFCWFFPCQFDLHFRVFQDFDHQHVEVRREWILH